MTKKPFGGGYNGIYTRYEEDSREIMNLDLYRRVRRARKERGLPTVNENVRLKDHELVGKKIYHKEKDETGTIEQVNKQWHLGWYYCLLVNFNGSHAFFFWENIDSESETTLDGIERSRRNYKIL